MFGRAKGQSTLEYVILIGFIVSALIAMGVYMKRGVQGKLRESTDQVGEQYSVKNVTSDYSMDTNTIQHESVIKLGAGKTQTTTNISVNKQDKSGSETVKGYQEGE